MVGDSHGRAYDEGVGFMKKRFATGTLIGTLLFTVLFSFSACGKSDKADEVLKDFEPPFNYKWEGHYVDEDETTTLVIEKKSGKKYQCVISTTDESVTHIDTYEFTAEKKDYGLVYENGVHTTYDIPDFENTPDASVETSEVYSDGTGSIYYLDEHLYWLDDKNDAGSEYVFSKVVESTEE